MVCGRKQACTYITNTLPQCSPASVGLAQASPNNFNILHNNYEESVVWRNHISKHSSIGQVNFVEYVSDVHRKQRQCHTWQPTFTSFSSGTGGKSKNPIALTPTECKEVSLSLYTKICIEP